MEADSFSVAARSGNVARLYDETAECHAEKLALETDGKRYTHAELRDRSARFAGGLQALGLRPGDRIALFLPNCPEFVIAALGALKAGTPFVPMNPQYRTREVAYRLDDSDATAVVVDESLRETAADAIRGVETDPVVIGRGDWDGEDGDGIADADRMFADVDGEPVLAERTDGDVAMQPYTSGTTGTPKGVLLTHRNLRAQSFMGFERTALDADEERFLSVLPLSHIAGFVNRTWQPLVRGASVFLRDSESWDPEAAMATIESKRITKFGAVAAMYVDIVEHDSFGEYDLSSLAESMEGGATMPTPVQETFENGVGVELFEAYGLTETGGGTHAGINATFGPRPGTIGQPFRATDCAVVDEDGETVSPGEAGELLVRGPHVMKGYHERPEATDAAFTDDGYFKTGDIVRRDEDNYYEVLGRKSDVIVTAGYNVYPGEVEEVLYDHPDVAEAAVVGKHDDRRGETVAAYVVPATGVSPNADRLREYCLETMAAYKHPREIEFVRTLPRTTSGKVQRFELGGRADD
ncbi:AMP-binding protein [Haladaptatus sp. T7]|uniref:class I adenylate-forming enzyme family protein n=1 Tax=Haladaptatus sp. T7 TaxID=2029368 RepID=UPI0021A25268|nr:AMP-binding protein [Haladaptatus sp. T7]GKZ13664.1 long-chain-fatty-acid--CoA ligase [Haladaptatus sp. T7]